MSQSVNAHNVGLAIGGLLGLFHLTWSLLIAIGLAQPLLDLIFQLHMIRPVFVVEPFSLMLAVGLIIVTSLVGYVFGYVAGWMWNAVQKGGK